MLCSQPLAQQAATAVARRTPVLATKVSHEAHTGRHGHGEGHEGLCTVSKHQAPRRSLVSGGRRRLTLFPRVRTVGNAALGVNRAATQLKGVFTSPERSGTGHRKLGQVEDSGLRSGASLSSSSHECLSSLSVHRIAGR